MTTLSLLLNIDELDKVKIKKLPIPDQNQVHPDIDWMSQEFNKWSKQFPGYNQRIDDIMNLLISSIYISCISKERLLIVRKATDIIFLIDNYIQSEPGQNFRQLIENLLETLKTGKYENDFIPGKRLAESLKDIKSLLNEEQWDIFVNDLDKGLRAHLDIHCNYVLKKRFISHKEYVTKRLDESCD